jgi:hypothetical protein
MYITNPESIKGKIKTTEKIGKYLIKNKIPVLSIDRHVYYFSDTEEVRQMMESLPLWLKVSKIFW